MRYLRLAVFPLVYGAAFALFAWWLGDSPALNPAVRWQILLPRALGAAGCFAAFAVFSKGDHLRRAWLLLALMTLGFFLNDLRRVVHYTRDLPPVVDAVFLVLLVGCNVVNVVALGMLASAWRRAASFLRTGRGVTVLVTLVTAGLALAVAGPSAVEHYQQVVGGNWRAIVLMVSAVADVLALCLISPLILTAISLRGGPIAWPWGLLSASMICWLLFDGAAGLGWVLGSGHFPATELFRAMALTYLFGAGLAQRLVVVHARRVAG